MGGALDTGSTERANQGLNEFRQVQIPRLRKTQFAWTIERIRIDLMMLRVQGDSGKVGGLLTLPPEAQMVRVGSADDGQSPTQLRAHCADGLRFANR